MKKIFSLLVAVGALFAVSCGNDPTKASEPSLSVEPPSLNFGAVAAPAQTVTVTASNVEWELKVPGTVSEWLKVDQNGNTLSVTVSDNTKPEKRTGSFTVNPVGNADVKAKTVTVVQDASSVEYKLSVEPAALTFAAEEAPMQAVTVTTEGEGLTWTVAAEGDAGSWITATPKEGKIEVSVSDNPDTKERVGNIVVTPNEESAGKKAIRVTQAAKVLPSSLTIDVEDPQAGLTFGRNGMPHVNEGDHINVTAVNVDWDAKALDAEDKEVTWFTVDVNKNDGLSSIHINMQSNDEFEERVGYVVITTDNAAVPGFRVKITQDAAEDHHSNLTDNVDVSDMTHAYAFVSPNNDWEDAASASGWTIRFWSDGIEHDLENYTYTGTGGHMEIEFASAHMLFNAGKKYSLAEGEYTIATKDKDSGDRLAPFHVVAGSPGFWEGTYFDSWYFYRENDVVTLTAPITEGTVTVAKAGGEDRYTFTFDCVDDLGYKITGSFTVDLGYRQNGDPSSPPIGGGEGL